MTSEGPEYYFITLSPPFSPSHGLKYLYKTEPIEMQVMILVADSVTVATPVLKL
jgi:hypothetical protein